MKRVYVSYVISRHWSANKKFTIELNLISGIINSNIVKSGIVNMIYWKAAQSFVGLMAVMTNPLKIVAVVSLPLVLVPCDASPVGWHDQGENKIDCDGRVGMSLGNCNLICTTTNRNGFEIEGKQKRFRF